MLKDAFRSPPLLSLLSWLLPSSTSLSVFPGETFTFGPVGNDSAPRSVVQLPDMLHVAQSAGQGRMRCSAVLVNCIEIYFGLSQKKLYVSNQMKHLQYIFSWCEAEHGQLS